MAILSVKNILILSFLSQVGLKDSTASYQLSYYNPAFKNSKLGFQKLTQFNWNKLPLMMQPRNLLFLSYYITDLQENIPFVTYL